MKLYRKYIFAILGAATLCIAMNSFALTLGRAKGSVLLGQALTLRVPVALETGEGASALCFDADVFYGDSRQDASRVSVSSDAAPQSPAASVTIVARAPVDEPVVTVYLRAGCESKTSRRYVMLAELSTTLVDAPTAVNPPRISPTARSKPTGRLPEADRVATTAPRTTQRVKAPAEDARPQPVAAAKPVAERQKTEGRRAHLKLAPLDLMPEREPALKLTNELILVEGEDAQKRAGAVALWRSLNATPQDIAGAETRERALESDLRGLHDITVKNRQLLEELSRRLSNAESERYSNPLVYALLAAVALCCLFIALFWNRAPRGALAGVPWWRDDGTEDKTETVDFGHDAAPSPDTGHIVRDKKVDAPSAAPPHAALQSSPVVTRIEDIDFVLDGPSEPLPKLVETQVKKVDRLASPAKPVSAASSGHIDFAHSLSATLRSVNTKEMLDVRQQAEFFMTLGQHDEAIALLSESVDGSADANPLVYLELLKVLHTLGRKAEYDQYRSGFNAIFSGHVLAYVDFNQSGSGLEAYPQVCRRIVALWPSEDVVSYIGNCLVRAGNESGGQEFDLEAFRDLLMLHGVASRIASSSFDSGFVAFSTAKTVPAPINGAPEVDVDLDLSEPRDNLIDFDASGWLPSPPAGEKQKPH